MNNKSIKDFFDKNRSSLAVPAAMIILGIIFFCVPGGNVVNMTVRIIGILFVAIGLILAGTLLASYSVFTMAVAITLGVFGIICIAIPGTVANFVLSVIGVIIMINSLMRIYDAYRIKGKSDDFIKYIINDIITLILGIVLLVIPGHITDIVSKIIGAVIFILGISNIITVIKVYKDGKYVDDDSDVVWEE